MSDAAQRVALVTGASSGFGLLAAVELARRGMRVFASMRDVAKRGRLDAAAAAAKVQLDVVRLDVTDEPSIRAAVREVEGKGSRLDVLVNNAGFGMAGFFEDLELAELREQFETNFFGLAAVMQAVMPGMRQRRAGRIINVSSIGGRSAKPGLSAYCSSKFAVEGLSEAVRMELLPYGVHVVLVEPGSFRTEIFEKNRRVAKRAFDPGSPYYDTTKRMEALIDKMVARSKADPQRVADVIADAATARRPRLRYVVGVGAHAQAIASAVIPMGVIERLVVRVIGHKAT
jgi:NAD(P)-dependent dehydrogenase (short-subunit alcohol dehydrogenase family)